MSRKRRDKKGPAALPVSMLLEAVPQPNAAMTVEERGEGLLVSVPMERPRWLVPPISWILPFSAVRRVELDALGRQVLESCDGTRTVEEVIEKFSSNHTLSFREGQVAVTQFLRELMRRGIVALVGTVPEESP